MVNRLPTTQLVILGGGCAGLSLASRLAESAQWTQKTIIIEPRETYTADRSWCFWEPTSEALQRILKPLIRQRWGQWCFSGADFHALHQADGRAYCYVAAEDFYQAARRAIHSHPQIELWQGYSVKTISAQPQGYLLTLHDGTQLSAAKVIDTRPPVYQASAQAKLWQIFYGLEIKTASTAFNQATVGLMAELSSTPEATEFIYLLPFQKDHALIEWTLFTPTLRTPETLAPRLTQWLTQKLGANQYTVLRKEQACLPMGLKQTLASRCPHYLYAGNVAGAIRPATGYAFLRIQRWAYECATALITTQRLTKPSSSTLLVRTMDKIFLRVLRDAPHLGVELFQALAERVPGSALVRFLSEEARLVDYWQVINALPARRFLTYSLGLNTLFYPSKKPT